MWPREQHRRKIPTGASLGLTGKKSYGWKKSYGARGWMWLRHYSMTFIIEVVIITSYIYSTSGKYSRTHSMRSYLYLFLAYIYIILIKRRALLIAFFYYQASQFQAKNRDVTSPRDKSIDNVWQWCASTRSPFQSNVFPPSCGHWLLTPQDLLFQGQQMLQ